MKPPCTSPKTLVATLLLALVGHAEMKAEELYWTAPESSTWSSSEIGWTSDPLTPPTSAWTSGSGVSDIAIFEGTGSPINLGESLSAGGLRFNGSGHSIGAASLRTLTLTGITPVVEVAAGQSATLGANVRILSDQKKLTKLGAGELVISYSTTTDFYLGSGAAGIGTLLEIGQGSVRLTGSALDNTRFEINVANGAEFKIDRSYANLGGFSGDGAVTAMRSLIIALRGIDATFSGTISGAASLQKLNHTGYQRLSGNVSNTFTGNVQVMVGGLILAKEEGATAISGSEIIIGSASMASISNYLRLEGEQQISAATDLQFFAGNNSASRLELNGFSSTMADLIIGTVGTGSNTIDFGINTDAQILQFDTLTAAGALSIINFDLDLDHLRFLSDPTAGLSLLSINGEGVRAIDQGAYWDVTVIPEPSSWLMLGAGATIVGLGVVRGRKRVA